MAYSCAIIPPMEVPSRWKRPSSSASTRPCASCASSAVVYGPSGAEEPPSRGWRTPTRRRGRAAPRAPAPPPARAGPRRAGGGLRPLGGGGAAHAAVVERHHAVALGEGRHLGL